MLILSQAMKPTRKIGKILLSHKDSVHLKQHLGAIYLFPEKVVTFAAQEIL